MRFPNPQATRAELSRGMGFPHATAMVVGTILGVSIFVQPSEISRHVPSVPGMMAVWLIAGVVTFCGALVCAELAAVFPRTGGVYVFLRELFSPALGFLWGWAMFWSVHSGIIAALAVVFARYVAYFAPLDDAGIRIVAIAGIWLLSAVNYFGVRAGSTLQVVVTAAKLFAVALMLVLFFSLGSGVEKPIASGAPAAAGQLSLSELVFALMAALFTYGGWHMVTYTAGETRDAARTIPRALLVGTLTVTACYLALNAAYVYVLPLERVMASTRVAADAAEVVLGSNGGAMISALVILSGFGVLNGIILAGPRVYYAMAHDGLTFRWLGAVHPRYESPHLAILLQAAWSSVLVATNTYRELYTRVVYTEWLFFALLAVGIFRLRSRPGYAPVVLRRGYPAVPLIFILSCGAIVLHQLATNLRDSLTGLLLLAAGLPVYFAWARHKSKEESANARY